MPVPLGNYGMEVCNQCYEVQETDTKVTRGGHDRNESELKIKGRI